MHSENLFESYLQEMLKNVIKVSSEQKKLLDYKWKKES